MFTRFCIYSIVFCLSNISIAARPNDVSPPDHCSLSEIQRLVDIINYHWEPVSGKESYAPDRQTYGSCEKKYLTPGESCSTRCSRTSILRGPNEYICDPDGSGKILHRFGESF